MEGYITGRETCASGPCTPTAFNELYHEQEPGYGVPRTCFGNKFTNDAHYTTVDFYTSSPAIPTVDDVLEPVDGHRFTIILTDDLNRVVDVFSAARDSSDAGAQNDLTVAGFDFAAAGPGFPTTTVLGLPNIDLSTISWTKATLAPA